MNDIRYALRQLAKSPGFAVVAVLTLGLGIGANAMVLSTVDALLLRAVPFPEADRLVALSHPGDGPVAPASVEAWREQADVFDEVVAYGWLNANLAGSEVAERIQGYRVSPGFFRTLGVDPALGRAFLPDEDQPGREQVVLLSHGFWEQRFGADSAAVGEKIDLDGEAHTVIGVMPREVSFPPGAALWTPLVYDPASLGRSLEVVARLAPGVSLDQARSTMTTVAERLERESLDSGLDATVVVRPLDEYQTRYIQNPLLVLLAAVGFVLLIACANIANLLLVRATSRSAEIAVRRALGAGRWRIARQLLTESVVLALLGGGLGVLLGVWGIELFRAATPVDAAAQVAGWEQLGLDLRVLAFIMGVAVLAGLGFGMAPAFGASHADLTGALARPGRGTGARRAGRTRSGLVVAQVALAVVLLAGAGLMMRSAGGLLQADPGFDANDVLTMQLVLPRSEYAGAPEATTALYDRLLEGVRATPGVRSAGVVSHLPFSGVGGGAEYAVEGQAAEPAEEPFAQYRRVSPGFLDALRVPLVRGRTFTDEDRADAPPVALVDRAIAERHWPDGEAVGERLEMYGTSREIVGVVGSVHHWGAADGVRPTVYVPARQDPGTQVFLAVRGQPGAAAGLAVPLRRQVGVADPNVAVAEVKAMNRVISDFHAADRLMAGMLSVFALIALLIAVVGIYGVISYSVARRTREIGLRTALGADPRRLLGWVLGEGMRLVGIGLAVGLVATLAVTRFMASLLYGVRPTDPVTLAGVVFVLGASALAAVYMPARRATRVDPMLTLREE